MTPKQEAHARAKAFYLLKKWTSFTFLSSAVVRYRDFLDAYERLLDTPWADHQKLEDRYIYSFLPCLAELEKGICLLFDSPNKSAAYNTLVTGETFPLFGRSAEEWGLAFIPLFAALGVRGHSDPGGDIPDVGLAKKCWRAKQSFEALRCTIDADFEGVLTVGRRQNGGVRAFTHWTYESMFQEPRNHFLTRDWPPGRSYQAVLAPAPEKNESSQGQIASGGEIPVDGIYEPWFFTGSVGCPNYFLAGQTAHQYQPEGSDDLVPVRWRLIWEDKRYLDGTVPAEEEAYLDLAETQGATAPLSAHAGEPCPQTGDWRAPRLDNRTEHVRRGEPMPGRIRQRPAQSSGT